MITVIGNLKGGTGKSTVTFNLAVWLRLTGNETAVFDLDPQQTLTDVAALRREERIQPPIHVQSGPLPDVNLLRNTEEILIDVGTADFRSFKQALMIADRILIPVTPSQADIWSTQRFVQYLYKITQGDPPESITFINRADTNQAIKDSDEAAAALDSLPGVQLIPQRLCDRTVFRNSFSEGLAVFELEPRSRGSAEFIALAKALLGLKRPSRKDRPQKESAPDIVNPFSRHEPEESRVDQTDTGAGEYDEEKTLAAPEESQDKGDEIGEKQKHRVKEGKKAGKGKKHKKHKKEKKEKPAKKDKKDKKGTKAKKPKKGKKAKKGS